MRGLNGLKRCKCCFFEVWGISANMPNPYPRADGSEILWQPYEMDSYLGTNGHQFAEKEVKPDVHPRIPEQIWMLTAAKVPGTYPHPEANKEIRFSSSSDGGDGTWEVDLTRCMEHFRLDFGIGEQDALSSFKHCLGSRAVYVDGQQVAVAYLVVGEDEANYPQDETPFTPWAAFQSSFVHGAEGDVPRQPPDVCLVSISQQTSQRYKIGSLLPGTGTTMEGYFFFFFVPQVTDSHVNITVRNAYSQSYGLQYAVYSSYTPGATSWRVARVEYEGTRLGVSPDLDIFCTPIDNMGNGDLPDECNNGDYVIVLPSVRMYIDSTAPQPDECWVCAKTISGTVQLVTGRWLSKVYRTGIGSEDQETGAADGTLHPSEVENIILDAASPPEDYPDEEWENLKVWCYNRVRGHDLLLFTTSGDPEIVNDVVADFEDEIGGHDREYLNHGLPPDMEFVNGGSNGKWYADPTIFDDDDDLDGSTYSAITEENDVTKEGTVDLYITFHMTTGGTLTFWYFLDNRESGTRHPGFPFNELTSFPDPDNNLHVTVDGLPAEMTIEGTLYDEDEVGAEHVGIIDNINIPNDWDNSPEYFEQWRQVSITLSAGTHSIKWSLRRLFQDNFGHLKAGLDNVAFPELMIGDDIEGARRWYYDGTQVRRAKFWAWAKRDEETTGWDGFNPIPITPPDLVSRTTTVPHFITMDSENRILYGNPHYVVRILDDGETLDPDFGSTRGDGTENKGYLRFSASPNIQKTPEPPCYDPDGFIISIDQVSDPPWGSMQILPVGHGNFQLRGMNATVRDSNPPVHEALEKYTYVDPRDNQEKPYPFAYYTNVLTSGMWPYRLHAWTIEQDGTLKRPHYEIMWNFMHNAMAWPEAPSYASPPYKSNFETSISTEPTTGTLNSWGWGAIRPHYELALPFDSDKARYTLTNWIVPKAYSDALSRQPQFVWVRFKDDPPNDPEDEHYWEPDAFGPWPSAMWQPVQPNFDPTGVRWYWVVMSTLLEQLCDVETGEAVFEEHFAGVCRIRFLGEDNPYFYPFPDFDAIHCDCDC